MSDFFDNQQNYSAQSFGTPMPQEPKKRGNRTFLLACGGCLALTFFICCCCLVLGVFGLRQPIGLATMWGSFISAETYDGADWVVCEGSQAAQYTDTLRQNGARFTSFNINQEAGDAVIGTGTLQTSSGSESWNATFAIGSGGTFGRCIERIEVDGE